MTAEVEVPKTGAEGVIIAQGGGTNGWSLYAKGGDVSLYVDGQKDGDGRLEMTIPMAYSGDETCNVGRDEGSPVSPDYGVHGNAFSGAVNWVQLDLGKDDQSHLVTPEARFQLAMARQ